MAVANTESDGLNSLSKSEHISDAKAKKSTLRQLIPGTGEWANISAVDNGDGTYSLKTFNSSGLVTQSYDYISTAYPNDTTEVYTFKTGGSGGTTVATITIVYTDNTKENLSTVTKS